MLAKFVHDVLFGIGFGIGFALAAWVARLIVSVLSHAT